METEFIFSSIIFLLFFLYGGSNLYILVYLRKNDEYVVGLAEFISLFLGNIRNYKNLNKKFVSCYSRKDEQLLLNKIVAFSHLFTPFCILLCLFLGIMSVGFY